MGFCGIRFSSGYDPISPQERSGESSHERNEIAQISGASTIATRSLNGRPKARVASLGHHYLIWVEVTASERITARSLKVG